MLVSTTVAAAAAHANKTELNPFLGLTVTQGQVSVNVDTSPNVRTYFYPGLDEIGFDIVPPFTGNWTEVVARAALEWAETLSALPETGSVQAGTYGMYNGEICYVIQTHDRGVWGGSPFQAGRESLTRLFRDPWRLYPWKQPIDQYDAWKTVNAITGLPDECTHAGHHWRCVQGDGAGNNVWAPGVFGWQDLGAV